MKIEKLKNFIQSSHINFLIGSGLSMPYLSTLNNIETLLTEAANIQDEKLRFLVESVVYVQYFKGVMAPCIPDNYTENHSEENRDKVIRNYKCFVKLWNEIIAKRNVTLLDKQVNIFTTNIDTLVETASEELGVEFNDGFQGHLRPIYREDSFTNVVSKVSPLYQNSAKIPVFNYMKVHGSLNWDNSQKYITYDQNLVLVKQVKDALGDLELSYALPPLSNDDTIKSISEKVSRAFDLQNDIPNEIRLFHKCYDRLIMVNPRKSKFKETVLDLHFYELLRLYSNALEKSNSLLFVAGFSFADEHIAKITMRAANSNPTLAVIIFAYEESAEKIIRKNLLTDVQPINNNIIFLTPKIFRESQDKEEQGRFEGLKKFDLESINNFVFTPIAKRIY